MCGGSDRWVQSEGGITLGINSEPFLAVVMDKLTDEVKQESPWTMLVSEDIMICTEKICGRDPGEVAVCTGKK